MNRNLPRISVIIPIYNAEKFLQKCVDSILVQTFTEFELLLINDGSTDATRFICEHYEMVDSRVRVFHKENGGVSSARNVGLDNAQGEWVCFVDSDDTLPSDALEIMINSDAADLIVGGFMMNPMAVEEYPIWESCGVVSQKDIGSFLKHNIDTILFRVPWAKLFKKAIITNNFIRFDEGLRFGEDTLFVVSYLLQISSINPCNSICYNYYSIADEYISKYKSHNDKILEYSDKIIEHYKKLDDFYKLEGTRIVYGFIFDILKVNVDSGDCDIESFRKYILNKEVRATLRCRSSWYIKMLLLISYFPSIVLSNYLRIARKIRNAKDFCHSSHL